MSNLNDELQIYRGGDFKVTEQIVVRQHTIDEICEFGEERYLRAVSQVVSVPQNSIYFLTKMGIDFTKISDFELFIILRTAFQYEDTQFFIPSLDFTKSEIIKTNKVTAKGTVLDKKEIAILFSNGAIMKENDYKIMTSYIRKINRMQRPWFLTVGTESTKKRMIRDAEREYEINKDKQTQFHSVYLPLISSLYLAGVNCDVWHLKLYEFFDLVERLQLKEQANHIYTGIYSGCVEYNKVKNDLNWMKNIEFSEFDKKVNMVIEA